MTSLIQIIFLLLDVLWYLIVAQVIMSWLINFGILNMTQPIIVQLWGAINRLLEPIYSPIRNLLPATGGLDIAPLVVIVGIIAIRIIITNNLWWCGLINDIPKDSLIGTIYDSRHGRLFGNTVDCYIYSNKTDAAGLATMKRITTGIFDSPFGGIHLHENGTNW